MSKMKFSANDLEFIMRQPSVVDKNDRAFCTMEDGISIRSIDPLFDFQKLWTTYTPIIDMENFKKTIKKVEFYPPATKMTFTDGEAITVAARHGDEFDEETGVMHCILKRLFKGTGYNTVIRSLIKDTHKREAAEFLKKENEKKAKEAADKAKEEARKKEQKRLAREREEKIEIQKEAYIRAMKEMKGKK